MSNSSIDLSQLRREYRHATLSEDDVVRDPLQQFDIWLKQAIQANLLEPYAMVLATSDESQQPSARVVLLRHYDQRGFCFFTNYTSNKGRALQHNPRAALLFYWDVLERQIRIEGRVDKVSSAESDHYYQQRPLSNRISAWASPQSQVIASRDMLLQLEKQSQQQWGTQPERPLTWGGYRLCPERYEFWQGRESRLHDRIQYVFISEQWHIQRLAP